MLACDRDPADTGNEDEDIQDHLVYESTHRTLATVPLLAYVAELFRADVAWKSPFTTNRYFILPSFHLFCFVFKPFSDVGV